MTDQLYKGALNDACLTLAKQVLTTKNGVSNDIVETLAAKFQDEALRHSDFIIGQDRDPNLLTRAIYYLTDAHAIPPMGSDIGWFQQMLTCLVDLAVPNAGLTDKGAEFLKDLQVGIAESLDTTGE
jgi:hypothetical protein